MNRQRINGAVQGAQFCPAPTPLPDVLGRNTGAYSAPNSALMANKPTYGRNIPRELRSLVDGCVPGAIWNLFPFVDAVQLAREFMARRGRKGLEAWQIPGLLAAVNVDRYLSKVPYITGEWRTLGRVQEAGMRALVQTRGHMTCVFEDGEVRDMLPLGKRREVRAIWIVACGHWKSLDARADAALAKLNLKQRRSS